jgi:uncharacterized GH25 family protein
MIQMISHKRLAVLAASALLMVTSAQAHRQWVLPSSTNLSAKEAWVTFDAAVSNEIFVFEHNAAALDGLVVTAPDGSAVTAENAFKGRFRSVFDLKLVKEGTYRVALVSDAYMASYKLGNELKRVRGTAESLAKDIPAQAQELRVTQMQNRVETFVTRGKPSTEVLKPSGRGIELVPVTHPTDLVVAEPAVFRFLDNGKPAAGYSVTVILDGVRFRGALGEIKLETDAKGEVRIQWPAAGRYWLNVVPPGAPREGEGGPGGMVGAARPPAAGPAGTLADPVRRSAYSATLEVVAD